MLPNQLVGDWDGAPIAQVISNLVGNSIQHGDRSRPIVVMLQDREVAALLTVQSHGLVIPGDVLPEVFDPFRRRSSARAQRAAASGLGCTSRVRLSTHMEERCAQARPRRMEPYSPSVCPGLPIGPSSTLSFEASDEVP